LLQTLIVNLFSKKGVTKNDSLNWFKINKVSLEDIQKYQKNLFICFNGRIGFSSGYTPIRKEPKEKLLKNELMYENFCIHNKFHFYNDKKFNTNDPEILYKRLKVHWKSSKSDDSKMIISQFILQISRHPKDLLQTVILNQLPTLKNINSELNKDDKQIIFIDDGIDNDWFNISKSV
jgi:hypothetical protein